MNAKLSIGYAGGGLGSFSTHIFFIPPIIGTTGNSEVNMLTQRLRINEIRLYIRYNIPPSRKHFILNKKITNSPTVI